MLTHQINLTPTPVPLLHEYFSFEDFQRDWEKYLYEVSEYRNVDDLFVSKEVLRGYYFEYCKNKQPLFEILTDMNKGIPAVSIDVKVSAAQMEEFAFNSLAKVALDLLGFEGRTFEFLERYVEIDTPISTVPKNWGRLKNNEQEKKKRTEEDSELLKEIFPLIKEIKKFALSTFVNPDFFNSFDHKTGLTKISHSFCFYNNKLGAPIEIKFQKGTKITKLFSEASYKKLWKSEKYCNRTSEISGNWISESLLVFFDSFQSVLSNFISICSNYTPTNEPLIAQLSISPFDFLTASMNTDGWSTCFSTGKEYFLGTALSMLDGSSLVYQTLNEEGQKTSRAFDQLFIFTGDDGVAHINIIPNRLYGIALKDILNPSSNSAEEQRKKVTLNLLHHYIVRERLTSFLKFRYGLLQNPFDKEYFFGVVGFNGELSYCDLNLVGECSRVLNKCEEIEEIQKISLYVYEKFKETFKTHTSRLRAVGTQFLRLQQLVEGGFTEKYNSNYFSFYHQSKPYCLLPQKSLEESPSLQYFFSPLIALSLTNSTLHSPALGVYHNYTSSAGDFNPPFFECLACGEVIDPFISNGFGEGGQALFCQNCDPLYLVCEDCGDLITWENEPVLIAGLESQHREDGNFYACKDCYEQEYELCPRCSELTSKTDTYHRSNIIAVVDTTPTNNTPLVLVGCYECLKEHIKNKEGEDNNGNKRNEG